MESETLELKIQDDEIGRLAQELAALEGTDVSSAVLDALRNVVKRQSERNARLARIRELVKDIKAHMRQPGSSDHRWLYDEEGFPK